MSLALALPTLIQLFLNDESSGQASVRDGRGIVTSNPHWDSASATGDVICTPYFSTT